MNNNWGIIACVLHINIQSLWFMDSNQRQKWYIHLWFLYLCMFSNHIAKQPNRAHTVFVGWRFLIFHLKICMSHTPPLGLSNSFHISKSYSTMKILQFISLKRVEFWFSINQNQGDPSLIYCLFIWKTNNNFVGRRIHSYTFFCFSTSLHLSEFVVFSM